MSENFLVSTNPAQGYKTVGQIAISSEDNIKSIVRKARMASGGWKKMTIGERISYLEKIHKAFKKDTESISKMASMEMGLPIRDQRLLDMGDGFRYFRWYLDNAEKYLSPQLNFGTETELHTVYHVPFGIAAVIQPWNFPFCQFVWGVMPNLLAGNTVVFKHSEECPLTGKLIEDIIKGTDFPEGVFNEIYGGAEVGEMLLNEDIDLISFTGSYKTGKKIYNKASEKMIKAVLELGGSAPGIVFPDVSIDDIAELIYLLRFSNNGQVCDGLKRLIVHENIIEPLTDKLIKILSGKVIGDPQNEKTDLGPLVAKRQLELVESQVNESIGKGAKVLIGTKKPDGLDGAYYEPTILTNVKKGMRVWDEEVFGPVLPVVSFKTIDEAIELGNDTEYGLGGYVFSKSIEKGEYVAKSLDAGMVSINGTNYLDPRNPFGGFKHSGIGREHGRFGFEDVSQIKIVSRNK